MKGSFTLAQAGVTTTTTAELNYVATARGRLGFLPANTVLLYATAGPAWANLTQTSTSSSSGSSSTLPTSKFGWAAGAGGELRLASFGTGGVIARVEYLHYDFGDQGGFSNSFVGFTNTTGRLTADIGSVQSFSHIVLG
jgi:outer membrane immunogenic protein